MKMAMFNKNKQGFTIIEVVLVLAIAGLIFLMIFLGLPALQRAQRDAQIRQDVGGVKAALETYKSNNRGKLPFQNEITSDRTHSYLGFINASGEDCWPRIGNIRLREVENSFRGYLGGVSDNVCVEYMAANSNNDTGNLLFGPGTFEDFSGNNKEIIVVYSGGAECVDYNTSSSVFIQKVPNNLNAYVVVARLSNGEVYCLDNK